MIGIYFSGTGNTKYCLEKFIALYDVEAEIAPLEDIQTVEKRHHFCIPHILQQPSQNSKGFYMRKF